MALFAYLRPYQILLRCCPSVLQAAAIVIFASQPSSTTYLPVSAMQAAKTIYPMAYKWIQGYGTRPEFPGHDTEAGRVMGFLLE